MKNNKVQNNIPIGWQQIKLGDILSVGGGKDYKHLECGNIPVFGTGGYMLSVNKALCSGETVFIGRKGTIDKPFYFKGDFWTVDTLFYTYKFKNTTAKYVNNIFQKIDWKTYNEASGVPSLSKTIIERIKFNIPPLSEQNRIVSVLETWDKAIEKLAKKIEFKKNIKKGLMQRLLTGKIRLTGFSDNWKTFKLGKIGETYAGITGKDKNDFGFGVPFISYMNIYSNWSVNTKINDLVNIKESDNQNKANYGDIFFTTSSETPHEVGISSVLLDKSVATLYLNSFCFGFRLDNLETLTPEFAQYYFRGQEFRKKMTRLAQGASRFNLSKKYFLDTAIEIPSSAKEQTAIINILASSSKEIKLLEQKLKQLKEQKNYLLNNLITGAIRTPETMKIKS